MTWLMYVETTTTTTPISTSPASTSKTTGSSKRATTNTPSSKPSAKKPTKMRRDSGTSTSDEQHWPRPNASPGYWLCCLLPLAFGTRYLRGSPPPCAAESAPTYSMLTIAAFGMCVESLCYFVHLIHETGMMLKMLISFVPGLVTTLLYTVAQQQSWRFAVFWGFAVTFCYQNTYMRVITGLKRCFTYGEAAILVQGLMLFVLNAILQLPALLVAKEATSERPTEFEQMNIIMMNALLCLFVACWLLSKYAILRRPLGFYPLMLLLVGAVTCIPITQPLPVVALYDFIVADSRRILIYFYLSLVACTIGTVWWQLRNAEKASTSVRKIFHLLIVLVFLPGLGYQCAFLYISSGVALAIITVLELIRILDIPPLANTLKLAFAKFSDNKDAGILALTPFCLLIGCSLPIWIYPCACARGADMLSLLAGILAVGIGDTAASVVGSRLGRIRWSNSTRSLEGTMGYIVTVLTFVMLLNCTDLIALTVGKWLYTIMATLVTAIIEARTDQIDNLVLPLVFYIIINIA